MNNLLLKVLDTAILAGSKIMTYYNDIDYSIKQDQSPLTIADIKSNELIKTDLSSYSNFKILSEEGQQPSWQSRQKWKQFWLIDPLDGTKEFLKKNGEFTVNISLIENNIPILGVIFLPAKNILYYALKGSGSFKCALSEFKKKSFFLFNEKNKISVSKILGKKIRIVASRSHPSDKLKLWLDKHQNYDLIDAGSSLKFCLVAEGNADVYPRFVGSSEWDIAAGYVILKEAGGVILDENNNQIKFNKKNIRNPNFIASSAKFNFL